MVINIKKDILFFILDVLFIFWLIYNIAKSESEIIFYIIFLFLFIVVAVIFRIFKEPKEKPKKFNFPQISQNVAEWEKILYILGAILIILQLRIIKELLTINQYLEYYSDYILIINTFILSFGAFILFLRIKELWFKIKNLKE